MLENSPLISEHVAMRVVKVNCRKIYASNNMSLPFVKCTTGGIEMSEGYRRRFEPSATLNKQPAEKSAVALEAF